MTFQGKWSGRLLGTGHVLHFACQLPSEKVPGFYIIHPSVVLLQVLWLSSSSNPSHTLLSLYYTRSLRWRIQNLCKYKYTPYTYLYE